ncbi:methyltransferase domain-containing protein [Rhizobium sp. BK176]|uniref:methyltransferase domain-containing protein n=1 Tax=Rhizobium sp. BK176 TaxID=2587071 RepID=UPI0021682F21|nr:methyltransferase domain-containing protein [Rhizobium sp. BK176]MCS4089282.1 ubiquinone/menaquinone biosynthesis C-methylase UbiE [Rhizobium sp. BK176]
MIKLLVVLPTEDYRHGHVLRRLAEEASASGMVAEVRMQDAAALVECSEDAQALIADVELSGDLMRQVKAANPSVTLIGVHGCNDATTIAAAMDDGYSSLLKHRCTMMLALLPRGADSADRSLLITGERGIVPSKGLDTTARSFVDLLTSRVGQQHNRTELTLGGLPGSIDGDLAEAIRHTREWAKWSLFPKYEARDPKYPGAEFGFVAKRTAAGTLITARASNKERPGPDDFALITAVDEDGTVHVSSAGRKASLNAPLAHRILQERRDINYVVHSHVFLPEGVTVPAVSTPGTTDDWNAVAQAVQSGAQVINQPHHGTLILLEHHQQLLPILMANGLYRHNSEFYDHAYARFQATVDKPTSLERTINQMAIPLNASVLDLCCGTGASTLALQAFGLNKIDFADRSTSMLAVAESRLGRKGGVAELEDLSDIPSGAYDLVTVRQAFAYVRPEDLGRVAKNIARILTLSGRFVFNGFAKIAAGSSKARDIETERENVLVRTRENNQITDEAVLHTQRTEIVDFNTGRWDAVLDVNHFYQHAPERLREEFEAAGLSLESYHQGNSICYVASRSGE